MFTESASPLERGSDASIAATATAVPPHVIRREEVKLYMQRVFSLEASRLDVMMRVIDNAGIRKRHIVSPVEHIIRKRPLDEISKEYKKHSVKLGCQVAADCLMRAGLKADDIDLIITVSCTGFMIPSLDAYLANELGFRSDIRRLPITELGCAAGASALARAREFVLAFPGSNVLVVAVELSSLTFQRGDISQANLISSTLFGDGAAAAVVSGCAGKGPIIVDSDSYFFPHTLDAMGFELLDGGLHIVLSRDVPQLIRSRIREVVSGFLGRHGLQLEQLSSFIIHPGGQKLLAFIEEQLGLDRGHTELSWRMLSEYGNLSSASVLFVLHDCLAGEIPRGGERGLLAAFGPGFSSEMLLLQWPESGL